MHGVLQCIEISVTCETCKYERFITIQGTSALLQILYDIGNHTSLPA